MVLGSSGPSVSVGKFFVDGFDPRFDFGDEVTNLPVKIGSSGESTVLYVTFTVFLLL